MKRTSKQPRKAPARTRRKKQQLPAGTQVFGGTWKHVELVVASQNNILVQPRNEAAYLPHVFEECQRISDEYQVPVRCKSVDGTPAEQFLPRAAGKVALMRIKALRVCGKTSDACCVQALNTAGKIVVSHRGYVPAFFPGVHAGNYLVLDIDVDTGVILNWPKRLTQEQIRKGLGV